MPTNVPNINVVGSWADKVEEESIEMTFPRIIFTDEEDNIPLTVTQK